MKWSLLMSLDLGRGLPHAKNSSVSTAPHAGIFSRCACLQVLPHHYRWLRILGAVGWCTKGFVYGTVGALACHSAVAKHVKGSISPQVLLKARLLNSCIRPCCPHRVNETVLLLCALQQAHKCLQSCPSGSAYHLIVICQGSTAATCIQSHQGTLF